MSISPAIRLSVCVGSMLVVVSTWAAAQVPTRSSLPQLAPAREPVLQAPGQPTVAPAQPADTTAPPAAPAEPAPVTAVTSPPAGVTPIGSSTPAATASTSQAATADRLAYSAGKFALVLADSPLLWLRSVEGGTATSDVVVERLGPDGVSAKHIASVRFNDITLETDLQSKPLNDWIAASWNGSPTRKSGSIQAMDYNYQVVSELEFTNALVTETRMPALDASSKDAARITVKLSPEYTNAKPGSRAQASGSLATRTQSTWLPSNFRFEMTGLDGTKVNKIDAFTIRQLVSEQPVGEQRDYQREPGRIEFPDLKITLAAPSASTWTAWHQDFLVKGNSGQAQERNGAIIYMDPYMKNELGRVNLMNCGIFGLAPAKMEANSEAIPRIVADLYCERMEFVPSAKTLQ